MTGDTIYWTATAPGRAGVAVVRVSGPEASIAARRISGNLPPPREARLRRIVDRSGQLVDQGLILWFPAPASFTGEDVVEFQVHGSPAVLRALHRELAAVPGLRPAEPGEFTRRAFDRGRLDLTQVEGLADLIAAETEAQRQLALRAAGGEAQRLYDGWRDELIRATALVEAAIDFAEEDLPADVMATARRNVHGLETAIRAHLADDRVAERVRDGMVVAIVGPPNVGKSSLLNRLAGREAAIVTALPGTTRDPIEVAIEVAGYPLLLVDTAGLRETDDPVEREGVRRAQARATAADLRLILSEWGGPLLGDGGEGESLFVVNKCDEGQAVPGRIAISAVTGAGIPDLTAALVAVAARRLTVGESLPVLRERYRVALDDCRAELIKAGGSPEPELMAESLRRAAVALGRITGRVHMEEVLESLFREFCIGK